MKKKYSTLLNELHVEFKKTYEAMSEKNWKDKVSSYLDNIRSFSANKYDERIVFGWVAGLCEHAYYVAAHTKPQAIRSHFNNELKKIIKSKNLPNFLTQTGPIICGKSQPSFIDDVEPTLERFETMENLSTVFGKTVDAIIIGGSMSYIPFFGIRHDRKNKDFSDIDTLVVINDNFFKKNSWNSFLKNDIFLQQEKKEFINRIKIFENLKKKNMADVFSQRFSINQKPYTISNHFLTYSAFKRMVYTDLIKTPFKDRADAQYTMRDFRTNYFAHPCHARHTFNGERFESIIDGEKLKTGGFVSNMPGYIVSNGKFYPGVYQTVISPAFLVFYDRTGTTTKLVKKFEHIIYQEVKRMRAEFPSSTYAKAHNRYDIFPPGRYDEGHDSYVSAEEIKKYLPPTGPSVYSLESSALDKKKSYGQQYSTKNNKVRDEAKLKLENWKKQALKKMNTDIDNFIKSYDTKSMMLQVKKQGRRWYSVAMIKNGEKKIIKLPQAYRSKENNAIVAKEVLVQNIKPDEIMRLAGYEKLSRLFGKAYIATITDPADEHQHTAIGYSIVVPLTNIKL